MVLIEFFTTRSNNAAMPWIRYLARTFALALAIALCAWWSIVFTRGALGLSSLWVASGVLCGVLLTSPRKQWLPFLLAAFIASVAVNFLCRGVDPRGVALSFANSLDAWMVAVLVARYAGEVDRLSNIKRSLAVSAAASLIACSVSGLIAVLVEQAYTSAPAPLLLLFRTWLASHVLGMAIFATLSITARVEGRRMLGRPGRRLELAATLALITSACWLVFNQSFFAITYIIFPPLLLCVFRHRFSGFVPATAIIAIIATSLTAAGHGPFFDPWINDIQSTLMLQGFIASVCLLAFPVAVVLTERRLLVRRLVASERDYRILADHSHDLIVRMSADGLRRYTSPSATQLLGWPHDTFGKPRWELVHPEDIDNFKQTLKDVFADGETRIFTVRLLHAEGHYVWMELGISRVPSMRAGDPHEVIYAGRDVTEREEARQTLARLVRHDTLTELGNRMYFDERVELAVARSHRNGMKLAVLYIDIDRFKQINDTHGHAVGDAVLVEFASRLRSCVRATDFPARLGGDEFVVLVEDIDTPEAPRTIAEKLIASLHEEIVAGDVRVCATASIGIAESTDTDNDADALLRRADAALYAAKSAGRNTWRMA